MGDEQRIQNINTDDMTHLSNQYHRNSKHEMVILNAKSTTMDLFVGVSGQSGYTPQAYKHQILTNSQQSMGLFHSKVVNTNNFTNINKRRQDSRIQITKGEIKPFCVFTFRNFRNNRRYSAGQVGSLFCIAASSNQSLFGVFVLYYIFGVVLLYSL